MIDISHYEAWFITGSQHLYGPENVGRSGPPLAGNR